MIHKYRTQFELQVQNRPVTIEEAASAVRTWIDRRGIVAPTDLVGAGTHALPDNSRIQVAQDLIGDEEQWALRHVGVGDNDTLTWVVDIGLSVSSIRTLASVAMGVELTEQRAIPLRHRIGRPGVVATFADRFTATSGCALTARARHVDTDETPALLEWLRSDRRILPVVVVSVDPWSERAHLNSDTLQNATLGLGEVVQITKRAGLRLSELLRDSLSDPEDAKLWSVFGGGVRIYWPRLDMQSDAASPFYHHLWLTESGHLPQWVFGRVIGTLSWAATHRQYENWTDLRTLERRADRDQLERLSSRVSSEDAAQYAQQIARLNVDIAELRAQLAEAVKIQTDAESNAQQAWQAERDARAENRALKEELAACKGNTPPSPPRTADDAVARAREEFARTLVFASDLTVETNESGAFWYGALHALHDLCEDEQKGLLTKGVEQVKTTFPELLARYGCPRRQPKHDDTQVFKQNPINNTREHLRWRVHLRSGPLTESESLYWEPFTIDGAKVYLVGWIGAHPDP